MNHKNLTITGSAITAGSWVAGSFVGSADYSVGGVDDQEHRLCLSFPVPVLPNATRIKKAELTVHQSAVSNGSNAAPRLELYQTEAEVPTRLLDFEAVKLSAAEDGVCYRFDITHLLDTVPGGETAELMLGLSDTTGLVTLYGCSDGDYAPTVTVTCDAGFGVGSAASVHTHTVGPFVQGSVDLSRGSLMFEAEDFAWAGNRMPVTLRHLYTSALAAYPYTNNGSIDLITADFGAMNPGNGWKLNLMQSMKPHAFTHEGQQLSGYVYMDDNGDAVYFKPREESGVYEAIEDSDMVFDAASGILKQGEEEYLFDDAGRLIRISDEHSITSLTYVDNRLTAVTDGAGRSFSFAYDTENRLTAITAPDGTRLIYGYDGNLLTSITYPTGSKTVITYTDSKPASVSILDAENNVLYKVCYTFSGDRVSSVAEFGENNIEGKCSTYTYSAAARRTVVQSTEQADEAGAADEVITTVYVFGEDGEIVSQYAYAQDADKVGVSGVGNGIHPYFGENGIPTMSLSRNLMLDHSMETIGTASPENSAFGSRLLHISSQDSNAIQVGARQKASLQPGDHTFSAYLRYLATAQSTDTSGVFLRVVDLDGNLLAQSEKLTFSENRYTRMVLPFRLEQAQEVWVQLLLEGAGEADADGFQLEANPFASAYNLIQNGSFERPGYSWYQSTDESGNVLSEYTTEESFDGSTAMKLNGGPDKAVYVSQGVDVRTLRSERETFTLSGWAKAAAVPQRERETESHFRLRAEIHYNDSDHEDTSVETYTADFCACTEDWQYASVQFSKSKYRTVNKVFIFCDYDHNNGVALFDDIQLIRDSLETGLCAEDFPSQNYDDEVDIASAEPAEEYTAPEHVERKDRFGNAVTETTFTDGEFGTIYRAFDFGARDDETTTTGNDLLRETDARGNMTHYQVDTVTSRNKIVTDRCGNKTAFEYDASGKTTKVTAKAPDGTDIATVDYSYDACDELTAITRGDGMAYDLSYDAFHNLESIGVRGKAEQLVRYTYKNGNGRLKEISYANGDTMKATYNALGQLVAEKWFDAAGNLIAHYRYVYDNQGNVVRSVDISSLKEYNYMYEEGRISRAAECDITVDENGMVLTRTVLFTLRYVYDQEGSLIRKHVIPEDNTCHEIFFHENDGNDNTVLKAKLNEKTYTSHSKTDSFGRKVFDEIQTGFASISRQFQYHAGAIPEEHLNHGMGLVKSAPTTNLVKQIILSDGRTLSYEYDPEERITRVIDSVDGTTEYTYDAQGQLLTEMVNGVLVNAMTYDAYGNILTKNGKGYTYGDAAWKDKLTAYNGESITYDAQGNPLTYLGSTMTWEKGRQLKSLVNGEVSCGYTYNANGIRTSKTVNGVKHTYTLDGMKILRETWPGVDESGAEYTNYLFPLYDNEENVCGILYNDIPYYFQKNLQGDIVAICSQDGETVARYTYDAWGCCTITEDTSEFNIATANPFRYRGYYYDAEIGMYYLQSRYYDSVLGRFLNGDEAVVTLFALSDVRLNSFLYCNNDALNRTDPTGFVAGAAVASEFVAVAGSAGAANSWNAVGWIILAVVLVIVIGMTIWNVAQKVKKAKNNAKVKAALLLNYASTAATPPPPNKGGKGTKVTSKTLYTKRGKNGFHIDVENPGNRPGQIHLQKGSNKYIYNVQKQAFYDAATGAKAPKAIQDLLQLPEVIEAIAKGLNILGYFL